MGVYAWKYNAFIPIHTFKTGQRGSPVRFSVKLSSLEFLRPTLKNQKKKKKWKMTI